VDWKRIIKFSIILFLTTAIVGFIFGILIGLMSLKGDSIPKWVSLGQGLAVGLASIIVFARLGYLQRTRSLYHVLMVGLICWLFTSTMNVLFLHTPIATLSSGLAANIINAVVGGTIGTIIYKRHSVETLT
jgi:hypothetical protein